MNREIKFKVYVIGNKGKVERHFSEWLDVDGWKHDYYFPIIANSVFSHEELGDGFLGKILRKQYTGLNDNNGLEIYEGDIVKWGHMENREEFWHRYAVVEISPDLQLKIIYYKVSETQEKKPTDNYIFHWGRFAYDAIDLEVIGNIFENPEILQ